MAASFHTCPGMRSSNFPTSLNRFRNAHSGAFVQLSVLSSQSLQSSSNRSIFPPNGPSAREYSFKLTPTTSSMRRSSNNSEKSNFNSVARGGCPSTLRRILSPKARSGSSSSIHVSAIVVMVVERSVWGMNTTLGVAVVLVVVVVTLVVVVVVLLATVVALVLPLVVDVSAVVASAAVAAVVPLIMVVDVGPVVAVVVEFVVVSPESSNADSSRSATAVVVSS
mmetsp:Transcript_26936/g.64663  ORF Transcript_26936/g.64663 Transcript_26936/m.64663 type:complete len:223 (-) Transcript_26936:238-906(-)